MEVIKDELILLQKKCHEIKSRQFLEDVDWQEQAAKSDHERAIERCQTSIEKLRDMEYKARETIVQLEHNQAKVRTKRV